MLRWYEAALTDCRVIEPNILRDLYAGIAFPPHPRWTVEKQIAWAVAIVRGDDEQVPEDFAEWHALRAENEHPAPLMVVYRAAAAMFNASLAEAQAQGKRLDEKPTTPGALQRAVSRSKSGGSLSSV